MKQQIEIITDQARQIKNLATDEQGGIGAPVLLYFLGVPGIICVALWLFFFRG